MSLSPPLFLVPFTRPLDGTRLLVSSSWSAGMTLTDRSIDGRINPPFSEHLKQLWTTKYAPQRLADICATRVRSRSSKSGSKSGS